MSGKQLRPGSLVAARELMAVSGEPVSIPGVKRLIHLQFRRFAGCPVCNLHLRSIVLRHDEIVAGGITEVVVFHSPEGELATHVADLPFALIADPDKRLYREFGVESGARALLDPRVWGPIVLGVARIAWGIVLGRDHAPANKPHGGRLGLPADLLVDGNGTVVAAKYGAHAYDQWSVDELLTLASRAPRSTSTP
jgi:peroxiredoxin